ncbi:MAG: carboxypeptidase-like regulatory domain-containing protein [Thermoguttaceae bacterium]
MRTSRVVRAVAASLAVVGMCLPQAAFASAPPATPAVVDIALADGGVLRGQVVDLQGKGAVGNVPVTVKAQNREVAKAVTTADGKFAVEGLRGGVYHVSAGEGQGIYRLWSVNTAPPSAQNNAVVYTQNAQPRSTAKMLLANPIVIAGVVATAIAVPVALANSHSSSP